MFDNKIRMIVADDHALVRTGFCALLQSLALADIVAEAKNGQEVLALIPKHEPQLILMDIAMPILNGLETTEIIQEKFPHIKVIILSMHATEAYVQKAMQSGANGYLLKDAELDELELAIKSVIQGGIYLSPKVSQHIIQDYIINSESEATESVTDSPLTPRQKQVLRLLAEGNNTKEIANILRTSPKTIEAHRLNIMKRLEIYNVPDLVRYAVRNGLAEL